MGLSHVGEAATRTNTPPHEVGADSLLPVPSKLEVLCSCVKGVRHFVPNMPYGDANNVFANTDPFVGSVAIIWYPPSERYPQGTKHVAYVSAIVGDQFYIKQTNKINCQYSEEWVSFSDPKLLGFFSPDLSTP